MVFNATFGNISVISRRSVLLVEETGVPQRKPQTWRSRYFFILQTDTEIMTFIVNWIFYIAAKKEEKKPEPESESDEDMGFGLFD